MSHTSPRSALKVSQLYSQHKVLVPHRVEGLRFDLGHVDTPGGQHLLGAGAFLQLLLSLPEAELSLLLLLHLPRALAQQDSQHAVGVAVTWQAAGRHVEKVIVHVKLFIYHPNDAVRASEVIVITGSVAFSARQ